MIGRIGLYCCALFALGALAAGSTSEFNPVRHKPAVAFAAAATNITSQKLIVKLRDASAASIASGAADLAARHRLQLRASRHIAGGLHALQVQPATSGDPVEVTLARLRADPAVEYAEVDQRRYAHAVPNDPLFSGSAGQWYMQDTSVAAAATDAVTAWNSTTGSSGLVIAELDTGVLYNHPDLLKGGSGGRLLPGYDFITDPQAANDGDGRDADASDPGDWVTSADTGTTEFSGCTVEGSSWHGTRVAGILGAITNNSTGIAGLTWSGWILPVRVLGKCGGSDSDIIAAMLWAAGLHVTGVPDNPFPAKVINMSLGGTGSCPASYQTVINQLTAIGVLVVVSAGNEGGPVDAPANCSGVAGIAGLRHIGTKVGFSSLGPEIALSAPAGNCVNTGAGQPCLFSMHTTYNTSATTPAAGANSYTDQANTNLGTSFSAPAVAGIAGLMKSINGNLNSAQLIARLKEGAKAFPTTSTTVPAPLACHVPANANDLQTSECICTTQTCGAGTANAPGAVNAAARPIAAVTVPASVSAGQNVVLQGGGSAAACGHNISGYSWTIVNAGGTPPGIVGGNTDTATVVAPASGSFTVRLTVADDAGRTDSADTIVSATLAMTSAPSSAGSSACLGAITLMADATGSIGTVSVNVAPAAATLIVKAVQPFTATVVNTGILPVIWQVNGVTGGNASVGTITAGGVYTAPVAVPSPGTVTIAAISTAPAGTTGTAQVTIQSGAIAVSISPTSATLTAGSGRQAFSATIAGAASTAVNWQVNGVTGGNASVGTITAAGLYTAPAAAPSPATVTVGAVAQADGSSSATAQVTITTPALPPSSPGGSTSSSGGGGGGGGGLLDPIGLLALSLIAWQRRRFQRGESRH
jgi:serine protease